MVILVYFVSCRQIGDRGALAFRDAMLERNPAIFVQTKGKRQWRQIYWHCDSAYYYGLCR
jgi:hypothetical protein